MTMQAEHKEWLSRMYPKQPAYIPAAGCVEEAGELMHVLLKKEQEAMWGKESRYADADWAIALVDAIGDCAIYACSLCTTNEYDYKSILTMAKSRVEGCIRCGYPMVNANDDCCPDGEKHEYIPIAPLTAAAHLVSAAANVVLRPTSSIAIADYLKALLGVAKVCHVDFDKAVEITWQEVKRRKR